MSITQIFYKNTDNTISYELVDTETNIVVGVGGVVNESSTFLASEESITAAQVELDNLVSVKRSEAEALAAADMAIKTSAAQALVTANILTAEQANMLYGTNL